MKVTAWMRRAWRRLRTPRPQATKINCPTTASVDAVRDQRTHSATATLERLPDDVLVFVLALLDHRDLCAFVACSQTLSTRPVVSSAFQQRTRLVIPPDEARNHVVLAALANPLLPQSQPARIRVESPDSLLTLDRVADQIRSLTLRQQWNTQSPQPYWRPPMYFHSVRVFDWASLSPTRFPGLVELEISLIGDQTLDLQAIYDGVPQIQRLSLWETKPTQNPHLLRDFRELRAFKSQCEDFYNSWDLANLVGLPKLEELHLINEQCTRKINNAHLLAQLRPLQVLRVRGQWDVRPPDDALRVHLPILRELQLIGNQQWSAAALIAEGTQLTSLDATISFSDATLGLNGLASMPLLRKLTLRRVARPSDLNFLPALASLEHLTITVARGEWQRGDCRALRQLTNLKTLRIRDCSVGDFIPYLPKLQVLECYDSFSSRQFCELEHPIDGYASPIKRAVLQVEKVLTPSAFVVLKHVEELAFVRNTPENFLSVLGRLANVRRLFLDGLSDPKILCKLVKGFASLPILEELVLFHDELATKLVVPSNIVRARRLRVLELSWPSSLKPIGKMTQLELLYIESYYTVDIKPVLSLHKLREILLPAACSCLSLRKARGPGGSLPALQHIFHPLGDCLVTAECMSHIPEEQLEWRVFEHPEWVPSLFLLYRE